MSSIKAAPLKSARSLPSSRQFSTLVSMLLLAFLFFMSSANANVHEATAEGTLPLNQDHQCLCDQLYGPLGDYSEEAPLQADIEEDDHDSHLLKSTRSLFTNSNIRSSATYSGHTHRRPSLQRNRSPPHFI